jgi:hypothetical protein
LAALIDSVLLTIAVGILGRMLDLLAGLDASGDAGAWPVVNFGVLMVCYWLY